MSQEISRWADAAMYRSEPLQAKDGPRVTLLNATPDPLGSLAALCAMYEGRVVRSLAEVTDEQRRQAFADMQATELSGPLEVAQFHFLVEGVTRAFTHQMVRERQAFFAQESMRFAVVEGEDWVSRVAYPPSLAAEPPSTQDYMHGRVDKDWDQYAVNRDAWDDAIIQAQNSYRHLVAQGVPAEDARGLMPHAMTTRLHWVLDLRGLLHVAGLRLCTQAQFEWRSVMAQVVLALRDYGTAVHEAAEKAAGKLLMGSEGGATGWQFHRIADALRPVCYQQGRCGFMAKFDRGCTIRERVEANARLGRPSSEWNTDLEETRCTADSDCPGGEHCGMEETFVIVRAIQPAEWAADPTAARRKK